MGDNKTKSIKFTHSIAPQPKTQTELNRRIRSISYSDALLAVEWLNAHKKKPAYKRALKIKDDLQRFGIALDKLKEQRRNLKGKLPKTKQEIVDDAREGIAVANLQDDLRKHHNALNQLLSRYLFVPSMAYSLEDGTWRFGMVPKQIKGPETEVLDGVVAVRATEASVIAALARLSSNRELFKVRLCENCQERWRVSERELDKFCSTKCREEFYASSPEYKARKARNRRESRRNRIEAENRGVTFK